MTGAVTGTAKAGLTVTLGSFGTATTDAGGLYSFEAVPNDTYTLTCEKDGYHITGTGQSIAVNNDDVVAVTMTITPCVLSGYVVDSGDTGIEGVTITLQAEKPRKRTWMGTGASARSLTANIP